MDKRAARKIAKDYIRYLIDEKKLEITKAYLFGSFAKGHATEHSDIDIALVMPKLTDKYDMMAQLIVWRRAISVNIEPHPFHVADFTINEPIVYEILKTGIPIMV